MRGVACASAGGAVTRHNFPIMDTDRSLRYPRTLRWHVPWPMMIEHEDQALRNHGGQSLDTLANRGGLGPDEAIAVLEGRRWRKMDEDEARAQLRAFVAAWESNREPSSPA